MTELSVRWAALCKQHGGQGMGGDRGAAAGPGRRDRPPTTDPDAVVDAIFYIAQTGGQGRQLPKDFPPIPRCSAPSTAGVTTESGGASTTNW